MSDRRGRGRDPDRQEHDPGHRRRPAAGYAIGMILFSRFSLNELEHADVLAELQRKRVEGG